MKVLIVVDMQNDFITGSLGTPEAQAIVPNVKKKVEGAIKNGDLIIYTRDTHSKDYLNTKEGEKLPVEHCIEGTPGWEIRDELLPPEHYKNYWIEDKNTFGSNHVPTRIMLEFTDRILSDEPFEIELIGLCTDICVVSNALVLKAWFYELAEISVDATCCAGVTPMTHEAALKTMEMCQINVKR